MAAHHMPAHSRADKTITVRVAQWDGFTTTYCPGTPHTINATHTLQQAISQAYTLFPRNCLRVVLRRDGAYRQALWERGDIQALYLATDLYDTIAASDEVVIVLRLYTPDGPGAHRTPPVPAAGPPRARLLSHLLLELQSTIR